MVIKISEVFNGKCIIASECEVPVNKIKLKQIKVNSDKVKADSVK